MNSQQKRTVLKVTQSRSERGEERSGNEEKWETQEGEGRASTQQINYRSEVWLLCLLHLCVVCRVTDYCVALFLLPPVLLSSLPPCLPPSILEGGTN